MINNAHQSASHAQSQSQTGTKKDTSQHCSNRRSDIEARSNVCRYGGKSFRINRVNWPRQSIGQFLRAGKVLEETIKELSEQLELTKKQALNLESRLNHLQSLKTLIEEQCGEDE